MRERGVKISGWQRFWDAVKPPPPVPKEALRRHQEARVSTWQRLWSSIKPPPKATQPGSEFNSQSHRRRRTMLAVAAAVILLGGAGTGIYSYVASAPSRADAVLADGMRMATIGKYQDAIASFTRAVEIYPRLANGFLDRGRAHQNLGEQDAALADFEQALAVNPSLAAAHTAAGSIYRERGDLNRAMQEFTAGINAGASVDAIYQRGQTYESMGQNQKALEDYDAAILQLTDAPYVYLARAQVRENLGDVDGAREDRTKAFEIQHPLRRQVPPAQSSASAPKATAVPPAVLSDPPGQASAAAKKTPEPRP